MRVRFVALVLAFLLPSLMAQAMDSRRAFIVDVIDTQLEAFKRDDASAAFAFANPDIQAIFGTPANFLKMVAEAYQPVYRSQSVTYLDLIEKNGRIVQRVLFSGSEGKQVLALYVMERSWTKLGVLLDAFWLTRRARLHDFAERISGVLGGAAPQCASTRLAVT